MTLSCFSVICNRLVSRKLKISSIQQSILKNRLYNNYSTCGRLKVSFPKNFSIHTSFLKHYKAFSTLKIAKYGLLLSASGGFVTLLFSKSKDKYLPVVECQEKSIKILNAEGDFPYSDFFWKYLLPEVFPLALAVIAALLGAVMNMKIPIVLGNLINLLNEAFNNGLENGIDYYTTLKEPVMQLVGLYVMQGLTTFAYISFLSHAGENIACKMRQDLFRSYLHQDVAFHDQHKTGALIDRLTSDIQDFKSSFKLCVSQGLRSSTQTIGCICGLYSTSPKLTITLGATLPLIVLVGAAVGSSLRKLSKKAQHYASNATAKANEVIANFRTVRAFANESYEDEHYSALVSKSCTINQYLGIGIGAFQGLSNIALNGIVLGVIYAGGYLVASNELNAGQLMSFLVSAQMIQRSLASLSVLFGTAVRGISAGTRAFEFIQAKPEHLIYGGRKIPYHCLLGHLRFNNVHFAYPHRFDHPVLSGVNLDIQPCQKVALCGLSGAGKSTIAGLIERFYEPVSGNITLDGVDLRKLDSSWLRGKTIGFINQEPVLFSGTIEENIRYGHQNATTQEIMKAAKLANAHDFIEKFPSGYKTVVGERGLALSGGQKQRIAIARALLKNPSILILDEATSALDAESERLVQDALDHITQSRTTLIIAHRLSTIKNADLIAVMKEGRIVEVGKHDDLKKRNGIYADLIRLQESRS